MTQVDEFRPNTWAEYRGQEKMKARLRVHIDAAREDHRPMEPIMLAGQPGYGKSSMARVIARERGWHYFSYTMPLLPAKLAEAILYAEPCSIIVLDEIHRLPKRQQEDLLDPIENGYFQRSWGHEYIEPPITIIGCTTEYDAVIKPLRERFHITPPYEDYTLEDMTHIVKGMGLRAKTDKRPEGIHFTDEAAQRLARASTGVPRHARTLVLTARDCPDPQDVDFILDLMGLTEDGLNIIHIKYLNVLRDSTTGKAGVKTLAASAGVPEDTIQDMEQILVDMKFVERTAGGRMLLPNGYKFINAHRKAQLALTEPDQSTLQEVIA